MLRYLWDNNHLTPFEMVEMVWEVTAPIFVARQWFRHRAASYNEFSMRYADPVKLRDTDDDASDEDLLFYHPEWVRDQHPVNKQSSLPSSSWDMISTRARYRDTISLAYKAYRALLDEGVAREQARLVLPVSTYTKFWYKVDMRNFLHFLDLRLSPDAQWEIQQYAGVMKRIAAEQWPEIMRMWAEGRRDGASR